MTKSPAPERDWMLTNPNYGSGTVRHIVLFRYRKEVSDEELTQIKNRFHHLATSRRGGRLYILNIESGAQISPEGLGQGFHHAFIVSFRSQGDRNYYVGEPLIENPTYYDPMHHAFKAFIGRFLDGPGSVLVFDLQVNES